MPRLGQLPRLATKLTLSTLAGAALTWAVAWAWTFYWTPPAPTKYAFAPPMATGQWAADVERSLLGERWLLDGTWTLPTNYPWPSVTPPDWTQSPGQGEATGNSAFGFPFRCLKMSVIWSDNFSKRRRVGAAVFHIKGEDHAFPIDIMPLGFAANTALTAALILGLWEAVILTRRQLRKGRGHCPSCAYDRRGLTDPSAPCPECGHAID